MRALRNCHRYRPGEATISRRGSCLDFRPIHCRLASCAGAKAYNSSLRQLLHVGFKVAAKMGQRYLGLLEANEAVIAKNVTENLYNRHIAPVFLGRNG